MLFVVGQTFFLSMSLVKLGPFLVHMFSLLVTSWSKYISLGYIRSNLITILVVSQNSFFKNEVILFALLMQYQAQKQNVTWLCRKPFQCTCHI
jgi:hypothetical protein